MHTPAAGRVAQHGRTQETGAQPATLAHAHTKGRACVAQHGHTQVTGAQPATLAHAHTNGRACGAACSQENNWRATLCRTDSINTVPLLVRRPIKLMQHCTAYHLHGIIQVTSVLDVNLISENMYDRLVGNASMMRAWRTDGAARLLAQRRAQHVRRPAGRPQALQAGHQRVARRLVPLARPPAMRLISGFRLGFRSRQ